MRAPMAANGMPLATDIECATVVRMATILVFVQPTRLGYSDGDRPRVLMSCCSCSGVKCECPVLLRVLAAGANVLYIGRYREHTRAAQSGSLGAGGVE